MLLGDFNSSLSWHTYCNATCPTTCHKVLALLPTESCLTSQRFTWSQAAHRHQSSELKAVMTALKSRDGQLATAQRQLQGLQEADANDKQSLADIIAGLRGTQLLLRNLTSSCRNCTNTSCKVLRHKLHVYDHTSAQKYGKICISDDPGKAMHHQATISPLPASSHDHDKHLTDLEQSTHCGLNALHKS